MNSPTLTGRRGARPGAAPRGAGIVLFICCFSLVMTQVDATAVNVALPTMGRDLGGGVSALQWVVDGYVLALACLGVTGGGLGDRFGRRIVYLVGLAVFTLASLACGAAPDLPALIAARVLQGVGASMLMPVTLAIIAHTFADPAARTRAIGVWAGSSGVAAAAGPLIGGALVAAVDWRAIFVLNVPIGALGLFLTHRYVPESRAERPRPFDFVGQTLWILTTASLTYALIHASSAGWLSTPGLLLFGTAAVAAVSFGVAETRSRHPLIDPALYRDRAFVGASLLAVLFYLAFNGILFIGSLQLQQLQGLSPMQTGLRLLPAPAALALGSTAAGRLAPRLGARPILLSAAAALTAGSVLLVLTEQNAGLLPTESAFLLLGAGLGLANPLLTDIAMVAMPPARAGVTSATVGTSRQLGAVLGVAVMGSLATVHGPRTGHIATHTTPALDPRPGYLAATAAALTAALLTTWSTSRRAAPDATTPAEPT
ncbi:MFS transporter [Actinomadura nitritigenes]|nr:MFS transporter [Actinomadura nitritigenes]